MYSTVLSTRPHGAASSRCAGRALKSLSDSSPIKLGSCASPEPAPCSAATSGCAPLAPAELIDWKLDCLAGSELVVAVDSQKESEASPGSSASDAGRMCGLRATCGIYYT
eukprot:5981898-Prymnesium_polylepis.1